MEQQAASTVKVEIKSKSWTGRVLYTAEVSPDTPSGLYTRIALEQAVASGAVLRDAVLRGAVLRGAVLRGAVLSGAVLSGAVLSGADLRGADLRDAVLRDAVLSGAVLSGAVLRGAVLSGAVLSDADLRDAVLSEQKNDFWEILLRAPREIAGLRAALVEGRVDGSTYEGSCACLVGTIANVRAVPYSELGNGISPDSGRPAEQWFMNIRRGDTPETNQVSALTVQWLDEFVSLLSAAQQSA